MKLIDIDDFLKFVKSLEDAGAEHISFDDLQKFANEQSDEFEREIADRLKSEKDFCAEKISCGGCYSYYDGRIDGVDRATKIIRFRGGVNDAMGCGIS